MAMTVIKVGVCWQVDRGSRIQIWGRRKLAIIGRRLYFFGLRKSPVRDRLSQQIVHARVLIRYDSNLTHCHSD